MAEASVQLDRIQNPTQRSIVRNDPLAGAGEQGVIEGGRQRELVPVETVQLFKRLLLRHHCFRFNPTRIIGNWLSCWGGRLF